MDSNSNEQNIPLEDIDEVARAEGTTRAKILQDVADGVRSPQDITNGAQQRRSSGDDGNNGQGNLSPEYNRDQFQSDKGRQDGYNETQGTGYGQSQNTAGQPADAPPAQQSYDPAHSGVRHAQNRPGTQPPTPGRETGTSWGEDQQMGGTTDTPDRENPAG